MLRINSTIVLPDDEIQVSFVRSSGPGGQNVNKVSTAVQLRFDVKNSPSLPRHVKARLRELAGRRLTEEGVLVLEASRLRTQLQNRQDALERLVELIRGAAVRPKKRFKTKPTAGSKERRLQGKKQRAQIKQGRRRLPEE
jgi:ribosome-associated protein